MTFSSLDVHLYTEALLNTMNFVNNLLPASSQEPTAPRAEDQQGEGDEEEEEDEKEEKKKEGSAVVKAGVRQDTSESESHRFCSNITNSFHTRDF